MCVRPYGPTTCFLVFKIAFKCFYVKFGCSIYGTVDTVQLRAAIRLIVLVGLLILLSLATVEWCAIHSTMLDTKEYRMAHHSTMLDTKVYRI